MVYRDLKPGNIWLTSDGTARERLPWDPDFDQAIASEQVLVGSPATVRGYYAAIRLANDAAQLNPADPTPKTMLRRLNPLAAKSP